MLKSNNRKSKTSNELTGGRYKRLAVMGEKTKGIVDELYSPIDAINRFINLALHDIEEGSQSRQFLLESKQGIRKTSVLLKKLNECTARIEKEIRDISEEDGNGSNTDNK